MEERYNIIINRIDIVSKGLLIKIASKIVTEKDIYLKNSIAKSVSLLKSIQLLYKNQNFYDGWILFRSLVDRLVYIYHLDDNNLYEIFVEWSYIRNHEQRNKVRADETFKRILKDPFFEISTEQARKYSGLKKGENSWNRPDPYKILKSKGLDFLYKYGYDYASMHTHPMAKDGEFEFYQMTGLEPNPYKEIPHETLMLNSVLVCTMILQEVLNFLSLKFRALLYSFLEETRNELDNTANEAEVKFQQILTCIHQQIDLFE